LESSVLNRLEGKYLLGKRGLNCGEYGVYGGFNKKVVKKDFHKLKIL